MLKIQLFNILEIVHDFTFFLPQSVFLNKCSLGDPKTSGLKQKTTKTY